MNSILNKVSSYVKHNEQLRVLLWCLVAVITWRIGLEVINQFMGSSIISHVRPLTGTEYNFSLSRWTSWDGVWYHDIASKGYQIVNNFKGPESIAFFPAFPILAFLTSYLTGLNSIYGGLLINLVLTVFICNLTYRITEILGQRSKLESESIKKLAKLSVAIVLLSPSAFFFAAFYADALLVLAFYLAIYWSLQSKYLQASLACALATATKSIGIVTIPVMLLIMLQQSNKGLVEFIKENFVRVVVYGTIGVGGLLAYMSYLYIRFGDPLVFWKIQKYWESRSFPGFFVFTLWRIYYKNIFHPAYFGSTLGYIYHLIAMLAPVLAVAIAVYLIITKKTKFVWLATLLVMSAIIPLSAGGTVISSNRYLLVAIGPCAAFYCTQILPKSRIARDITPGFLYLSSVLLFISVATFLSFNFAG